MAVCLYCGITLPYDSVEEHINGVIHKQNKILKNYMWVNLVEEK